MHTADHRAGAMHGKQFLVDCVHTGIDENFVYGRMDFVGKPPELDFDLVVNLESRATDEQRPRRALRLDVRVQAGKPRVMAGKFSGGANAHCLVAESGR